MGIENVGLDLHLNRQWKLYILCRLGGTALGSSVPVIAYLLTRLVYPSIVAWIVVGAPLFILNQTLMWGSIWRTHRGKKVQYTDRKLFLSALFAGYFWSPLVLLGIGIAWAIATGNRLV